MFWTFSTSTKKPPTTFPNLLKNNNKNKTTYSVTGQTFCPLHSKLPNQPGSNSERFPVGARGDASGDTRFNTVFCCSLAKTTMAEKIFSTEKTLQCPFFALLLMRSLTPALIKLSLLRASKLICPAAAIIYSSLLCLLRWF